jgi:hypothetical protein
LKFNLYITYSKFFIGKVIQAAVVNKSKAVSLIFEMV